jgi:hypothetical protein
MQRTVTFLSAGQIAKLKAISDKTGAPISALIRMAVVAYLKERAKEST